jgi:hypothetical protein
LTVIVNLFARKAVGLSMKPTLSSKLFLNELIMAEDDVNHDDGVTVHSDLDTQ